MSPPELIEGVHYEKSDLGCWLWIRSCSVPGYGQIGWTEGGRKRNARAHRVSWEKRFGSIPDDHDLHHKCGVSLCVNPEHLEAIPHVEHQRIHALRGMRVRLLREARKAQLLNQVELEEALDNAINQIDRVLTS